MDIGTTTFVGCIARGVQLRYENETVTGNFSLCLNKRVKVNGEWVDNPQFFEMIVTGRTAENMKTYTAKGQRVTVVCEPVQERWQAPEGKKSSRVVFRVIAIDFGIMYGAKNKEIVKQANDIESEQMEFAEKMSENYAQ